MAKKSIEQDLTTDELEKMITDYVSYWEAPHGRSDIEAQAANVLHKNALNIARQLLKLLKAKKH